MTVCRCMQMPAFQYDVMRVESTFNREDVDHGIMLKVNIRCKNCNAEFGTFPETSDHVWAFNVLFAKLMTEFKGPINPIRDKLIASLHEIRTALGE
jgi:hypothetical protein